MLRDAGIADPLVGALSATSKSRSSTRSAPATGWSRSGCASPSWSGSGDRSVHEIVAEPFIPGPLPGGRGAAHGRGRAGHALRPAAEPSGRIDEVDIDPSASDGALAFNLLIGPIAILGAIVAVGAGMAGLVLWLTGRSQRRPLVAPNPPWS